jgi:arylsulfatase A-like enzyme
LKDNGIDDNTLVIFTSDNGGAGYIGIDGVNSPFRGFKLQLFEGGIHVPFMMRWPKHIAPGTVVADPVQHFDVYATAAAAAGANVDQGRLDGVNLLPFTNSSTRPVAPPHDALFWLNGEYQVMLSAGWKLQKSQRPDTIRLFNMAEDPTEQHNVAAQNPQRVQQMLTALAAHAAQQPAPAWPAQVEVPLRIDRNAAHPWRADDEYVYVTN